MKSDYIKEFGEKLKVLDDRLNFKIVKDGWHMMYKTNSGMYRTNKIIVSYDGTNIISLCMIKNTVPLINADNTPMLAMGGSLYIGKDRADMFADVIKLCAEYMDVLCEDNE